MSSPILLFDDINNGADSTVIVMDMHHVSAVNPHSHEFYEFVYVQEGFTIHNYGDSTTILTEGDMFAVRPGTVHSYTGLHYTKVYNCIFTEEAIKLHMPDLGLLPGLDIIFGKFNEVDDNWVRLKLAAPERIRINSLLKRMLKEQNEKQLGWELVMNSLLLSFLTLFSRYYTAHYIQNTSERNYLIYAVKTLKFIDKNYSQDIDMIDIAASIGVSPDYLARQFKKIMGLTPIVFLRSYRLARSMSLIKNNPFMSLKEIATNVGYKHLSHFSREFKSFVGLTPSEYRLSLDVS